MPCSPRRSSGPGSSEHLVLGDPELRDQQLEHRGRHRLLDLEAYRWPEPAPQQLLLERGQEVLGVVLLDLDVLVAGDPERVRLEHLHAREEPLEVGADDVLERHEAGVAEGHEAVEGRRHLHPGEVLLAGLGVADQDGQVEREPGDVGERVGGVDGERRQHREDPVAEEALGLLLLLAVEVVPAHQLDLVLAQRRHDLLAEQQGVPLAQLAGAGPDALEHLQRHQPGRRADGQPGRDPALEAGHPHHEELVEVAGEDRQVAHPLEQRQAAVLGQLQHPLVEPQPRQLAVEEAVLVRGPAPRPPPGRARTAPRRRTARRGRVRRRPRRPGRGRSRET